MSVTPRAFGELKETVPVRVRVGVGLVLMESILPRLGDRLQPPCAAMVSHGWKWVGGKELAPEDLYREFSQLNSAFLALSGVESHLGMAAISGAYYLLYEVYAEALEEGNLESGELPTEVRSGDEILWQDFQDALEQALLMGFTEGPFLERLVALFSGDPADRSVKVEREPLYELFRRSEESR